MPADKKNRAIFANAPREGESEAGQKGRIDMRQQHLEHGAEAAGSEQGRCLLDIALDLFEYRLDRPPDEGDADQDHGKAAPEGLNGFLGSKFLSRPAHPRPSGLDPSTA